MIYSGYIVALQLLIYYIAFKSIQNLMISDSNLDFYTFKIIYLRILVSINRTRQVTPIY